jgi:hypothetical protein
MLLAVSVSARDTAQKYRHIRGDYSRDDFPYIEKPAAARFATAAVDTYCIAWFDFEKENWQGWTVVDNTAQADTFTHIDDFSGLAGGSFGRLLPIEGTKSIWCGARAGYDEYMCSWLSAPGYGNDWEQMLVTDTFAFSGILYLSYHAVIDCEAGYEKLRVEYDAGDGDWQEIEQYTGIHDTIATHELIIAQAETRFRFRFTSDSGFSDEDGNYDSDGAFIVDSLTIEDGSGVIDYEDFESGAVGAKSSGLWHADVAEPFGSYAGLGWGLNEPDPCGDNFRTQIVFFIGSPYPSATYPGLYDTPFCKGTGGVELPCQSEMAVSPVIDLTKYSTNCDGFQNADIPSGDLANMGGVKFLFTVYRDNPIDNLVLYGWRLRSIDINGCPGPWHEVGPYYGPNIDYATRPSSGDEYIGSLITEDRIQVAVEIMDWCYLGYITYGTCASHTPSPWFDNIRLYRYNTSGPQWKVNEDQLFQDTFPIDEFDIESYCRADMAADLNFMNPDDPIRPGDSIIVQCSASLAGGLDTVVTGGSAVFCHSRVTHHGPDAKSVPSGAVLAGDYGWYYSMEGDWTVIQMDSARSPAGTVENRYMLDLNDSLFTRGMRIEYYFKARDLSGKWSSLPQYVETTADYYRFNCLPTLSSDILFVDDGWDVWEYWRPTFEAVLPQDNQPDVYYVQDPGTFTVNNDLGSRAKIGHLTSVYRKIIWDSGFLAGALINSGEGSAISNKSPDARLLIDWMNLSEHEVGLWVCGDNIAENLSQSTSMDALNFLINWCGVILEHDSYYEMTGGRIGGGEATPLIQTVAGAKWPNPMHADSFYANAGCPRIKSFDVLEKTTSSQYVLAYPTFSEQPFYAGIQNESVNAGGHPVKTMWFGFSMILTLDAALPGPGEGIVRNRLANAIIEWMGNETNENVTDVGDTPPTYRLTQNFPNPFNPQTTILFDMPEKGHVTLKIYNVAGQLVRTLVDDVRNAGSYKVDWDGRNNENTGVSSGIYFYKMETRNFRRTRKMILLR